MNTHKHMSQTEYCKYCKGIGKTGNTPQCTYFCSLFFPQNPPQFKRKITPPEIPHSAYLHKLYATNMELVVRYTNDTHNHFFEDSPAMDHLIINPYRGNRMPNPETNMEEYIIWEVINKK